MYGTYKKQNIAFEMIIPNRFADDRYNFRFRSNQVFKWHGFKYVCVRLASQSRQSAVFFSNGDWDFFDLQVVPSVKRCIKLPLQSLFSENVGRYFFYLGKTLIWVFLGVFNGNLDFYLSLSCPSCNYLAMQYRYPGTVSTISRETVLWRQH